MSDEDKAGTVPFTETQRQYEVWRWRLEQPVAQHFTGLWSRIAASSHDDDTQITLVNVAWGLAALERAWHVLLADVERIERTKRDGAPAIMVHLSGGHQDSLNYLLAQSLWLDLGDVLTAYRVICDRFKSLTGSKRRGTLKEESDRIKAEHETLKQRTLPALSAEPVVILANNVLHQSWHPDNAEDLSIQIVFKGDGGDEFDFARDNAMQELQALVAATRQQIDGFLDHVL